MQMEMLSQERDLTPSYRFQTSVLLTERISMQVTPKVMPPICFHRNYSIYKEHNNTVQQSKFSATKHYFSTVTTISSAFSPTMNKSLHAALVKICTTGGDPLFQSCYDGVIASFIISKRWKSEGTKSELQHCCGRTVQPRLAMYSTILKQEWSLTLLYCKRKYIFFSVLTLEV